jgi:glycosyltransferase involved in cell wall biosynthesis
MGMPEGADPLVSIVVPTYNEEEDIAREMDTLAALTYRPLEVIVVDKSTDRTPEIVRGYQGRIPGLRIVPQGDRPGVSVARNAGLRESRGEIVIVLNADVFLPPDFVERIMPHYRNGADYVLVDSRVINTDRLFPRYLQAQHEHNLSLHKEELQWTEAYSCRREAALSVGGFPEAFGHNTAGEDGVFGGHMSARYRRAMDFSIVVPHLAPHAFRVYWRQRLGRGRGGAYRLYAYEKQPIRWFSILRSVVGTLALVGLLIPPLVYALRLVCHSERGLRDWLPFTYARMVEVTATAVGYWIACREIARANSPAA